jgi:hypothetical protein
MTDGVATPIVLAVPHGGRPCGRLDTFRSPVHNRVVRPQRLTVPDARGQGAVLRVTGHLEQRKVVLSHWRDGLCVASTPVELGEVPALIGVLADALGEAVESGGHPPAAAARPSLLSALRGWLRPKLAHVIDLPLARGPSDEVG